MQLVQALGGGDPILVPAHDAIVFVEHGGKFHHLPIGWAASHGDGKVARWQGVLGTAETFADVEETRQGRDTLTKQFQVRYRGIIKTCRGGDQLPELLEIHSIRREITQASAVPHGSICLVVAKELRLALDRQGVSGPTEKFTERRAAQVTGTAFGDGIGQGCALGGARVISGHLQALDVHGERIRLGVLAGNGGHTLRQPLATTFYLRHLFEQRQGRGAVTEAGLDAVQFASSNDHALEHLHYEAQYPASADRIQAVFIAVPIQADDRLPVADAAVGTHGKGCLILRAFDENSILKRVGVLAAGYWTAEASIFLDPMVGAESSAGHLVGGFKLAALEIAGGQRAHHIDDLQDVYRPLAAEQGDFA